MAKNASKKKSQIFLFDLIFSFVIFVVSLSVFLIYYTSTSTNTEIYDLNSQILNGLTQTKINSLNSQEVRDMFLNNQIRNIDNTVAQQISEFHHLKEDVLADDLARIFIESYLTRQMNFELLLDNSSNELTLFSEINREVDFENSELSAVSSRVIFGFINRSDSYGPHIYTVRLWQ